MLRKLLGRLSPPRESATGIAGSLARQQADRLISAGDDAENAGDLRTACERYRAAVTADSQYARAHLNLGTALEALGDAEGAIASYRSAVALEPTNAPANYNLGRLLLVRGAVEQATDLLQAALTHRPGFPEALVALSSVHESQGNLEAAAAALEEVLASRNDWTGALTNYAVVLRKMGRLAEAEAALGKLIALEPRNGEALYDLATLLHARGDFAEAARLLRCALEYRPDFADAYGLLSHVHEAQGSLEDAASALREALRLQADWPEALHNYGIVLRKLRRLSEAEEALRRAITVAPGWGMAHEGLAGVLFGQGRIAEAARCLDTARELVPDRIEPVSTQAFILNHSDEVSSDTLWALHREAGRRLETAHPARFPHRPEAADPERRLRVGYVSGDFCHHPVSFFLVPVLEAHDRARYEIVCYSVGTTGDEVTPKVRSLADAWHECATMGAEELADRINADGIDILVDLSGHSGASRLAVFAQQPAPVQIAWLGYPNTTGLTRIQYRITDPYTDPPGVTAHFYSEALIRLPFSQWCYRPPVMVEIASSPPVQRNGYVTFGSFNQLKKLSPTTRRLWARILTRVPDSRLFVAGVSQPADRERFLVEFREEGIEDYRLCFLPHTSAHEYFRRIGDVDIALDPTPYSGCTTSFDTLWMGVPIIALAGSAPASRTTAAILKMMHLEEWIAPDGENYIRLARTFSRQPELIAELRRTLRQTLADSPVMDASCFTRDLEHAYRQVWRTWCHI